MEHQFPEGFKPMNIESYDGTTDPAVWIEDFLLHIHMARGDDLHAIKYLPLKLKGPTRHWLNGLPENSIGSWEDLEDAFRDNFQGTYVRPPDVDDLRHIVQQPRESARKLWTRFLSKRTKLSIVQTSKPLRPLNTASGMSGSPDTWAKKNEVHGSPYRTHDPLLRGRRQLARS